jgi:AbrB family looped-hinge helix DNA binding protein
LYTVKVSSQGHIVLPDEVREKFLLNEGDSLEISIHNDTILLHPVVRISDMRGIFHINGWSDELKGMRAEKDE